MIIVCNVWHSHRKDKKSLRRDRSRPVRMKRNNRIECIEIIREVLGLHSIHLINGQVATCPYRGAVEINKHWEEKKGDEDKWKTKKGLNK